MASTSDIKNGFTMVFKGEIYKVVDFQHVKPGKGPAFVRTKLKNLKTGRILDNTIPAGHKLEEAELKEEYFNILYNDGTDFHFMNNATYEQISLSETQLDGHQFLREGVNVDIIYHSETNDILSCELPDTVVMEVTYTEPGLKGDTATNASKPATLESGAIINVPLFINEGEKVKVDTKTGSYMERVK